MDLDDLLDDLDCGVPKSSTAAQVNGNAKAKQPATKLEEHKQQEAQNEDDWGDLEPSAVATKVTLNV